LPLPVILPLSDGERGSTTRILLLHFFFVIPERDLLLLVSLLLPLLAFALAFAPSHSPEQKLSS